MERKLKKTDQKNKTTYYDVRTQPSFSERLKSLQEATDRQAPSCEVQIVPELTNEEEELEASSRLADNCKKNPGHRDFIPIKELGLQHLPDNVRSDNTLDVIMKAANCTVKLIVSYTSKDRPKSFKCGVPAGFSHTRVGSGRVWSLPPNPAEVKAPSPTTGCEFIIHTAGHVVYDNDEAKHTTVQFFFDNDLDKSGVVEAKGERVMLSSNAEDICQFVCSVKDKLSSDLVQQALDRANSDGNNRMYKQMAELNFAFCVSHPHGLSKRVTFGSVDLFKDQCLENDDILKLIVDPCSRIGISEKKAIYVFYELYMFSEMLKISVSADEWHSILNHLCTMGYMERPSGNEKRKVKNTLSKVIMAVKNEGVRKFRLEHGSKHLSQGDKELERRKIFLQIVKEKAKQITMNLEEYSEKIDTEMNNKMNESRTCSYRKSDFYGRVESATHSCPTCPGSSGALVSMWKWDNGRLFMSSGSHSRGLRQNVGNVCPGGVVCYNAMQIS